MGQVYLNGLRGLSGPKSKLGLPSVTMELDKSLNQSFQGGLEKIGYTSSNGPSENYYEALEVNLKTCAKRTKLRVYKYAPLRYKSRVYRMLVRI